ncbi:MAG TPA: TetR/AcrR family transcriptional regulator [Gemmatimonadales bacterium]|nr:TetR/AcrR family transcriptional regulator [Gemmatimonadales bacterium]
MPAFPARQPTEPRWQRRAAARPEEILRAALTEFGSAGYAGARLTDIARRAGVSKATLYLYFDSKQALFREMIRAETTTWLGPEDAAAGFFPDTAQKKLQRFLRETWGALRRPEMLRLTRLVHTGLAEFPELTRFYFDEVILKIRARLERVLDAGRARAEFRAVRHDFALHAVPSWLLHQALLQDGFAEFDAQRLSDQALLEGSLDLLLHGIARRGTRADAE